VRWTLKILKSRVDRKRLPIFIVNLKWPTARFSTSKLINHKIIWSSLKSNLIPNFRIYLSEFIRKHALKLYCFIFPTSLATSFYCTKRSCLHEVLKVPSKTTSSSYFPNLKKNLKFVIKDYHKHGRNLETSPRCTCLPREVHWSTCIDHLLATPFVFFALMMSSCNVSAPFRVHSGSNEGGIGCDLRLQVLSNM